MENQLVYWRLYVFWYNYLRNKSFTHGYFFIIIIIRMSSPNVFLFIFNSPFSNAVWCSENMQPSRLLTSWIREFLAKITLLKPQFVALHLQEVGGKTYEKSMEYVQEFIQQLCESPELHDYNRIRVYLDEDYTSAEHFTVI